LGIGHDIQQPRFVKRFDQKLMRAGPHRLDRLVDRAMRRHHHDMQAGAELQHLAHQIKAVAVGQHEIQQDHLRRGFVHQIQPLGCGACGDDAMAGFGQGGAIQQLQRGRILDQQNGRRGWGHVCS
jgi:hypothetical protein